MLENIDANDIDPIKSQISNVFASGLDISNNKVITTITNDASNIALLVNVNILSGLITDNSDNITYLTNCI